MKPAIPDEVQRAINEALAILPLAMSSPEARVMLVAIGLQESRLQYRAQIVAGGGKGPARGLWQFERGTATSRGGIWGVFLHSATTAHLKHLCEARACEFEPRAIWDRIEKDDVLAAGLARLLLWTDTGALPKLNDREGAWRLYAERTWRPGKPHRSTWDAFHAAAVAAVDRRAR